MKPNEEFKLELTPKESYALNMIKGLPEDAHYLVILTKEINGVETLVGPWKTFESLLSALHEEVEYRLSPRSRLAPICNVIEKIEAHYPEEIEF